MPKGEAIERFVVSVHLVLELADKYPRDSLAAHILNCVAKFLQTLFCPCTRPDRGRQIISNVKRFQRGDWKGLWETCVLRGEELTPMLSVSIIALNVTSHLSRIE
jgi:hypothetical protein